MIASRRSVRLALLQLAGPPLTAIGRPGRTGARSSSRSGWSKSPRILLIRPDHLGDVLLATPVAAILRNALPEAQIEWLVGPWSAEIARRASTPADVLTLDFPGFTRKAKRSAVEPYTLLVREAARLRARRYEAALILRPDHWWGAMLAAAAGIPRRFGFSVQECFPFLTDTLPVPSGHVVRSNQELALLAARRLGGTVGPEPAMLAPIFPISEHDAAWAANLHATMGNATLPIVAIHPGTGAGVKTWLPERWTGVTRALTANHIARVVLTGGPGEQQLVEQIASGIDPSPTTLAGATTIGQLAALFARCDLVLGGDSGPLHLAAAVGTPTVRLYGPTDVGEFGPWPPDAEHVALVAGLACQPCRDLVAPPCGAHQAPPCLRAFDVDTVVAAATRLLASRSRWREPTTTRAESR